MIPKEHWEKIYTGKPADAVSWYQAHATASLELIAFTGVSPESHIIDVGGGASTLVDDLLSRGFSNIAVLDLSEAALQAAQSRLGDSAAVNRSAASVDWIVGDITAVTLPEKRYAIWHDRAVFHFLTSPSDRKAYKANLNHALKPEGHVILATFAEDGPTQCSGLPVQHYSVAGLEAELGPAFKLMFSKKEQHITPSGTVQNFNYCYFKKLP